MRKVQNVSAERSQKILMWWCICWGAGFFAALRLMHLLPPPDAGQSSVEVARSYAEHAAGIELGAVIAGWIGGFWLPFVVVLTIQLYRHERGRAPVWTLLACISGALMSIFIVFPPLFIGTAAFTPERMPDATVIMHQLGVLTWVTADQYVVFTWAAIAVVALSPNSVENSPFPRWFGYFTAWTALMFEGGAVAFIAKRGVLSWNSLIPFWTPVLLFGAWFTIASVLILKALNKQAAVRGDEASNAEVVVSVGV